MKITNENVIINTNLDSKYQAMRTIATRMQEIGLVKDGYYDSMVARDADISVYLGSGVAIPHGQKSDLSLINDTGIVIMTSPEGIEWNGETVYLVIGIAADSTAHREILRQVALLLTDEHSEQLIKKLSRSKSPQEIIDFFSVHESPSSEVSQIKSNSKKIIAVCACPVGVAHTFMAADNLQKVGSELGIQMKVETQGSDGIKNSPTASEIDEADAVILACDIQVDTSRFAGKRVLKSSTSEAIKNTKTLIQEAFNAPILKGIQSSSSEGYHNYETFGELMKATKKHLLNGVSYMIPIVVIGGIFIAGAIALSGIEPGKGANVTDPFLSNILNIGASAFSLMIPILAGFIAYSMAGKPGLAPGAVGGVIAGAIKAGFLGGIVAGLLAGIITWFINKNIKLPNKYLTVKTIFIIPLISSLTVGLSLYYVIGTPIVFLMESLTSWLQEMSGSNKVILGLILGSMIAFDMGGPINKVAFLFGVAMIKENVFSVMGMVGVAICIPPLAMGVSTFINKKLYSAEERESGISAFLMGLIGITEGAIPFAAADPIRVIPSIVFGSAIGGATAALLNVGSAAPHGGPITIPVVINVPGFIIAIVVGIVASCVALYISKALLYKK